jgi:3'(2'), 5'-bisphosphate nucleotidase
LPVFGFEAPITDHCTWNLATGNGTWYNLEIEMIELLKLAIEASRAGSSEILSVYNSTDFGVESKSDNSPLTLADKKAHAVIVEILKQTGLPILSEEGKDIPYSERKNWNRFWMVDPLDGTKEFIKRNGEFTVNIALIENQKPILGVVAVPVTGETYYGAVGMGAFKIVQDKTQLLPAFKKADRSEPGIRVVASRSHLNEETQHFINSLNNPQLVSKGSSLKFMMLADGVADIYPRFAPTMEWDTAAAHAVVNQLGIQVLQQGKNSELLYNKENLLNPGFVVE